MKTRLEKYGKSADAELWQKVKELVKRARITVTEALLLDGCIVSARPATFQVGLDQINEQIQALSSMPHEEAIAIEELNQMVWSYARAVTTGTRLSLNDE